MDEKISFPNYESNCTKRFIKLCLRGIINICFPTKEKKKRRNDKIKLKKEENSIISIKIWCYYKFEHDLIIALYHKISRIAKNINNEEVKKLI